MRSFSYILLSICIVYVAASENATVHKRSIEKPTLAFKTRRESHEKESHEKSIDLSTNNTSVDPLDFILNQLSLPSRRASDMVCSVNWEPKAKRTLLRCTELDLNAVIFEDSECDLKNGDCSRFL